MTNKVLIDCCPISNANQFRGIGSYVNELLNSFKLLKFNNFDSFGLSTNCDHQLVRPKFPASRGQWLINELFLPSYINSCDNKIVHFTDSNSIILAKNKILLATVYDLIPLLFWDDYFNKINFDQIIAYKRYLNKLKKLDHIIAISHSCKNDLIRLLNINPHNISVIPLGIRIFNSNKIEVSKKNKFSNFDSFYNKKYILYVGGHDFRKNIELMIESFSLAANDIEEDFIVLGKYTDSEKIKFDKLVEFFNVKNRVHLLGYVHQSNLPLFYKNASLFLFLSRYEGFGLPLLEAMSFGTPVISSNTSSVPEVVGNGGILVPLCDPYLIADKIKLICNDRLVRSNLIKLGYAQALNFSYYKTASSTIKLYNSL